MRLKPMILLGMLILTVAGLTCGLTPTIPTIARQEPVVKIGFMYPITGGLAPIGQGLIDGAMAGARRVNMTYTFDVELVIEDSGSGASGGTLAATNLVAEGVQVVIGAAASGASLAAAAVFVPEEIPQVSYASTSPALTDYEDNGYLFRTVASDVFQGQALAQLAVNKSITAPIIINRDDAYGNGVAQEFSTAFQALTGNAPVGQITYDPDAFFFSAEVSQIKASAADGIIIVSFPTDAIAIFNEAKTQGIDLKWLGTDGIASTSVTNETAIRTYLTGKLFGTTPASGTDPGGLSIYSQFIADLTASGGSPGIFGDYVYDAVLLVGKALNAAGVYDGNDIRDALYAVANGTAGATGGNKAFSCAGDPISQAYDYWNATNGAIMTWAPRAVDFPSIGTAATSYSECATATTTPTTTTMPPTTITQQTTVTQPGTTVTQSGTTVTQTTTVPGFEIWAILGMIGAIVSLLIYRKIRRKN